MQKVDAIAQMTYKLQSKRHTDVWDGQRDGLNELLSMRRLILILILILNSYSAILHSGYSAI